MSKTLASILIPCITASGGVVVGVKEAPRIESAYHKATHRKPVKPRKVIRHRVRHISRATNLECFPLSTIPGSVFTPPGIVLPELPGGRSDIARTSVPGFGGIPIPFSGSTPGGGGFVIPPISGGGGGGGTPPVNPPTTPPVVTPPPTSVVPEPKQWLYLFVGIYMLAGVIRYTKISFRMEKTNVQD